MDVQEIERTYKKIRREFLNPTSDLVINHLKENLSSKRIDQISGRSKTVDSFVKKSQKTKDDGTLKYNDPFTDIQDQIGVRIVTYYKSDLDQICEEVKSLYRQIEEYSFTEEKLNEGKFGYEGIHFIFSIPKHLLNDEIDVDQVPDFFELQVKTLFQHAWAQAEHELTYKPDREWSSDEKRDISFIASQAWAADKLFDNLFRRDSTN